MHASPQPEHNTPAPQETHYRGLSRIPFSARRARLSQRLAQGPIVIAPGVYEMISAKMADRMGFDALYMTGYGTVASYLGMPDAGIAGYTEMVDRVGRFAAITSTPMICDADTGFGGLLNVMNTVRGYELAGACMIQIEDQEFPKKCGHMLGRRVVPVETMVDRIRVAVETREDRNFLVIARTDARTSLGLDEALRRAERYARAGADVLFVESPESLEEMRKICETFDLPCLANMVEGGRTPVLSREELQSIGYRLAIFPATGFLAAGAAYEQVYRCFAETGSSTTVQTPLHNFQAFSKLMGFDWVSEFDRTYARED
jgi:2-methylisocitrate lyase-like PEP mutase family enzyme